MRWAKWDTTRPSRSDYFHRLRLCATEPRMLSVFKFVSRSGTINLNGIQSHPKSSIFYHSAHRKFSSIALPNRRVPSQFKLKKKRRIRKEIEDWTGDSSCRALQRLTSYRLRHGIGASILPAAPASVWTFKITSFCLWKRGPISRLWAQVGIVEDKLSEYSIFFKFSRTKKYANPWVPVEWS